MTAPDRKKLNGRKKRPSSQTATEKAGALANLTSSLGRPAKSLATVSLGAAASAFLGPGNANATPVATGPLPFVSGNTTWDVDGDGTDDFGLFAFGNVTSTSQLSIFGLGGDLVAAQLVNLGTFSTLFVANYATGSIVATTAPSASFAFFALDQSYPTFPTFTGNFVFRFTASGTPSLGWANFSFTPPHGAGPIQPFVINSGEYFPVADGPITVGGTVIPEPSSLGLVLLGMGALGLREWRRRRGEGEQEPANE